MQAFPALFPASVVAEPLIWWHTLKITCGQEAGVLTEHFLSHVVCHLFSGVRYLKGQGAETQLMGQGAFK